MKRIFAPTGDGSDWQPLLAKPKLHWKVGKSAMTLAASWEAAHPKLPSEIAFACKPLGIRPDYFAAFPEWQVALPGGATASQTDLLVLARAPSGLAVIAIEGKVDEPLGPTLGEKRNSGSHGVSERLRFLKEELGLKTFPSDELRYQLFHRAASARMVAREVGAAHAIMIVHSFSRTSMWYDDFVAFARCLGASASKGNLGSVAGLTAPALHLGWVPGQAKYLEVKLPSGL